VAVVPQPSPPIAEASGNAAASQQRAESAARTAKADSSLRILAAPAVPPPAAMAAAPPAGMAPTERLGTGHGQREWSASRHTNFERLSHAPQDLLEIAYDSYENLVLAGVIAAPTARARAFPGDVGRGFVADPPPMR
jgi:hypothetical protein